MTKKDASSAIDFQIDEAKRDLTGKKAEESKKASETKTSDKKELPSMELSEKSTDTVKTGDPAQAGMFMSTAMVGLAGIVAGLKGKFRKKEDSVEE